MTKLTRTRVPELKMLPIKLLHQHLHQCRLILATERELRDLRCAAWNLTYKLLEQGKRDGVRGNDGQNWVTSGTTADCDTIIHYIINLKVAISEA